MRPDIHPDESFIKEVFGIPRAEVTFRTDPDRTKGRILHATVCSEDGDITLKFSDLVKLTQHFGCKECDTSTHETEGCSTCGYGARYYLELTFWKFNEPTGEGDV